MKRVFDLVFSFIGLFFLLPLFILVAITIFLYDFKNPFYTPFRMGKNMKPFRMFKFRTMILNADKTGVISTSVNDKRILPVGRFIRQYKLDELLQLVNVLIGNMSLVGPRPQVVDYVEKEFTDKEKEILTIKPGITDFSSIIFSDEGEILKLSNNPDLDYNQLIRPWKSRLGIFYISVSSFYLDIKLIFLTIIAIFSRKYALQKLSNILIKNNAESKLIQVASRKTDLKPYFPPGHNKTVI